MEEKLWAIRPLGQKLHTVALECLLQGPFLQMLFSLTEDCHRSLPAHACSWCGNPSALWVQRKQQVERKKMKPGHLVGLDSWRGLEGILIYNCVSPQHTGNVWYSHKPGSVQVCMVNHHLYLAVQMLPSADPSLFLGAGVVLPHAAQLSMSSCCLHQACKCSLGYFCIIPREFIGFLFLVLQYDLLMMCILHAVGIEAPRW